MVSCARATRGRRLSSLDARSRRPASLPLREKLEERCSFDARSVKDGLANDRCYTFIWLQYCPVENKCISLKNDGSSLFHGF